MAYFSLVAANVGGIMDLCFGLCAVAGLAFIGVRVVTLVNAYLG